MHIKHISLLLTILVLTGGMVVPAQVNFEPYPVSEYVEQTGPNTMTFLSYPKYYKNALGELTPVDTTLVPSKSVEWDYEVNTGIWTLYVRNDGSFQARHKGDIFTYRFENLGIGRGNQFQALDLGKADWTNMMVIGDTVRWNEVFPNVDVTVRYIHDILKVDVKVKESLMNQIRSQVRNGQLNANDYLTARFEIPEVFISSQAKQGGVERDLYAEPISVNQPLEFVKDNKVVHKLRPVESYVLDDSGERILDFENPIRSQQQWRLNRNAPGIAEMSAHLGDLANAPEGDVVIDPSMSFGRFNGATKDSLLDYNSSTNYGGLSTIQMHSNDRGVISSQINNLGTDKEIVKATLWIYVSSNTTNSSAQLKAYNVTTTWDEGIVTWFSPWSSAGGDISISGSVTTILAGQTGWYPVDFTAPFKSRYPSSISDFLNKGILLRYENSPAGQITIISKENIQTELVWNWEVEYYPDSAQTQCTVHQPILKKRDGNKNNPNDRWFPIGSYFSIFATDYNNRSGWEPGNIEGGSGGTDPCISLKSYGEYFNFFMVLGKVDDRNKSSTPNGWQIVYQQDYADMINAMDNAWSWYDVDYYMLPVVVDKMDNPPPDIVTSDPWDIFSEATYYPLSFDWSREYSEVEDIINFVKSENRVIGWHLGDEPFGGALAATEGIRDDIKSRLNIYKGDIETLDQTYKHSFYVDLRGNGNFYSSTTANDLNFQDYIMDSSLYYNDISHHSGWEAGVIVTEDAMNNAILRGYGKGYIRFAGCRDLVLPYPLENANIHEEKIRYLAYSSWVAGGQGIIFFRYDHPDAEKWFEYNGLDDNTGISARITKEAYIMKDWLMDGPVEDIDAYCFDSLGDNDSVRFILRENQWGTDDRILLLFCNFADDNNTHSTYVYFPNHTISSIDRITADMKGTYTRMDNNKTLRFDPTDMDSDDVYGSACFLTLSAQ